MNVPKNNIIYLPFVNSYILSIFSKNPVTFSLAIDHSMATIGIDILVLQTKAISIIINNLIIIINIIQKKDFLYSIKFQGLLESKLMESATAYERKAELSEIQSNISFTLSAAYTRTNQSVNVSERV